ncbi:MULTISPECIES: hypothetical protein [Burkholderia]|uniref:hypothetical protein n=1 Tax=Burkholderia TaxID=32008 RepID=UPI0012EAB70D|nr:MULTISPECIES: hypothetical protein [Burkholderia]MBY4695063.1 hypothetical protein [Burkholderia latens]MCA8309953.1 hypothetical protein [Burkholderia sp. AU28942]QTO51677.1 hypothetical protein J8I86_19945 [Burkholderia latens]
MRCDAIHFGLCRRFRCGDAKDCAAMIVARMIIHADNVTRIGTGISRSNHTCRALGKGVDPNCRFTHPAMCAAYTFLRLSLGGQAEAAKIYRFSYLSNCGICEQVFGAALQLRGILSISTWLKKGKFSEAAEAARIAGLS